MSDNHINAEDAETMLNEVRGICKRIPPSNAKNAVDALILLAEALADNIAALSQKLADKDARIAQQWQPIETAPKDGTEILGFNDDGIFCVTRWSKHNHVPLYGWIRQIEIYGEEVDGFDPILWMPLPHQPIANEEGKEG